MYKLTHGNFVIRKSDGVIIPLSEGNRDYQEYVNWVADGNQADSADPIPEQDLRQLRKEAYISESDPLFMEWKYDGTTEAEKIWRDKVAEIKERYPINK